MTPLFFPVFYRISNQHTFFQTSREGIHSKVFRQSRGCNHWRSYP